MSDNVHLIPKDDLIEHERSEDCVCRPDVQVEPGGFIYIHHALDGREQAEAGDIEHPDRLLDDMASALRGLRGYFMAIAEQHPDMDTSALSDLLRRYDTLRGPDA